jgi:hypothetical protein
MILNLEDLDGRVILYYIYIIRMEDDIIPKNVPNGKFHNTRPVGKPRTRWKDVVRGTYHILGL